MSRAAINRAALLGLNRYMASGASEIAGVIYSGRIYVEKYRTPKHPDPYEVNAQMERLKDDGTFCR